MNKQIQEGFNLIIQALNEKTPEISAMTEKISESRCKDIQKKITGQGLFKEILLKIFPNILSDHKYKKYELNNFVNLPVEKVKQISENYKGGF